MLFIYDWLKTHKIANVFLAIIYYLLVVLPHEEVGIWVAQTLDQPYGRDTYNLIILVLGSLGLFGYLWTLWSGVKQLKEGKRKVWFAFLMTLFFIILSFNTLLVVNVEIIHFVQYAILAILLFPLFHNYQDTLFYAMVLGAIDEGYQYFVLAPLRTDYFDFNDVIIDLIGAALGLLLLWASGIKDKITNKSWLQSPTFIGFSILILAVIISYSTGLLAIFPAKGEEQAPILLVRKIQKSFWTIIHPNVKFHVITPLEGVLILGCLFNFYGRDVFGQGTLSVEQSPNL